MTSRTGAYLRINICAADTCVANTLRVKYLRGNICAPMSAIHRAISAVSSRQYLHLAGTTAKCSRKIRTQRRIDEDGHKYETKYSNIGRARAAERRLRLQQRYAARVYVTCPLITTFRYVPSTPAPPSPARPRRRRPSPGEGAGKKESFII